MSNLRAVEMEWTGTGLQFTARGTDPESPSVLIDGDNDAGASPMQHLLMAAGACAAIDVVMILQKMRIGLTHTAVRLEGVRREENPKRYVSLKFVFEVSGEGIDQAKADRAAQLSVEKYCSVLHTLASDLSVSYDVVLV